MVVGQWSANMLYGGARVRMLNDPLCFKVSLFPCDDSCCCTVLFQAANYLPPNRAEEKAAVTDGALAAL